MIENVLVTGADGFVGRRCVRDLVERGYRVVAATRRSSPPHARNVRYVSIDLLEAGAAEAFVAEHRAHSLLHLAWFTQAPAYWHDAVNEVWAQRSADLVAAFVRAGGRRIVSAGTCAEYAWSGAPCIEADTPLRPATLYGAMKLRACNEIAKLAATAGATSAWGRIFFAYGPGEDRTKLLSSAAHRILANEPVVLTSGDRRLDFVHVDDVARAFVALLDLGADGAYNIGSGAAVSVREAVIALATAMGSMVHLDCREDASAHDVVADVTRLSEAISWEPRDIGAGVRSMARGLV